MDDENKLDDLVRYENSQDNEEEEGDYVDYDFAYGVNIGNLNTNTNNNNEEIMSEYCSELNNDNKFLGMSRFDEASRVGFALDYFNNNYNNHKNSIPNNNLDNVSGFNKLLSKESKNNITQNLYETNLTNVNQNFNFNYDSEMEKIDFETNFDKNKIERILDERNNAGISDNIFESENYLKSGVFDKKAQVKTDDKKYSIPKDKALYTIPEIQTIIPETKSHTNLTKDNKNLELFSLKKGGYVSKSIDDFEKNNFISEEDIIKKYKVIKGNNNPFNLDKFKITNENKNNNLNNSDLDIELEADSEQIIDFQKSVDARVTGNTKKNFKINEGNHSIDEKEEYIKGLEDEELDNDIEIHYLNKLQELKEENNELLMKLNACDSNQNRNYETDFDSKKIKDENWKLREEIEELKSKYEKKSRESVEHKSKYETLNFEYELLEKKLIDIKQQFSNSKNEQQDKDNTFSSMKIELKNKDHKIENMTEEIINYKNQIENIKSEFNIHRQEMSKKAERLTELQQKIFDLEQENMEIRSKSSGELTALRDQKQNYDSLKSNFVEVKSQLELVNIKFQRVSDENYNLKRDLSLYEKELKTKNDMIEKLKKEILDTREQYDTRNPQFKSSSNNTLSYDSGSTKWESDFNARNYNNANLNTIGNEDTNYSPKLNSQKKTARNLSNAKDNTNSTNMSNVSNFSHYSHFVKNNNNNSNYYLNDYSKSGNSSILNNEKHENSVVTTTSTKSTLMSQESNSNNNNNLNNPNGYYNNKMDSYGYIHNRKNMETKINILPSQQDIVKKESRILDIETKLYTLQQEREKIRSELSRMPEFPKQKAQILKKKNYELSITDYNQKINSLKVELRELNALNRDY